MTTAERAIRGMWSQGRSAEEIAEFCFFSEHSFAVEAALINRVRADFSTALGLSIERVIATGSARIGFSLIHGGDFVRGCRDLDVAVVDEDLVGRCLKEVRSSTLGLSLFQAIPSTPLKGRRTATQASAALISGIRDGVLDPTLMPEGHSISGFLTRVGRASKELRHIFSDVSVLFYASRDTLVKRQAARIRTFLATEKVGKKSEQHSLVVKPSQFDDCPAIYPLSALRGIGHPSPQLARIVIGLVDALKGFGEPCKAEHIIAFPLGREASGELEVDVTVFYRADSYEDVMPYLAAFAGDLRKRGVFFRAFPATASGEVTASVLLGLGFEMSRYYGRLATDAALIVLVD